MDAIVMALQQSSERVPVARHRSRYEVGVGIAIRQCRTIPAVTRVVCSIRQDARSPDMHRNLPHRNASRYSKCRQRRSAVLQVSNYNADVDNDHIARRTNPDFIQDRLTSRDAGSHVHGQPGISSINRLTSPRGSVAIGRISAEMSGTGRSGRISIARV